MTADKIQKEITSLMKELNEVKSQTHSLYEREQKIEDKIVLLRSKYIVKSKILSQYAWVYEHGYTENNTDYVLLKAKTTFWKELEEATGNHRYHWDFEIVKDELKVGGDDGDMCLFIRKNVLSKWVKKLGLKVDLAQIEESIKDYEQEIAEQYERIRILREIKGLAAEEPNSLQGVSEFCPCWISPCDPDECKGSCEGDGGDCICPCDEEKWMRCPHFAKGCDRCNEEDCNYKIVTPT
jgi:hypothetical protein